MNLPMAVLAAVSAAALTSWVVLAVLVGIALGLLGARLATRRGRPERTPRPDTPAAGEPVTPGRSGGTAAALVVDDLPGFLEHPPGSSPRAEPVAPPAAAAAARTAAPGRPAGATIADRSDTGTPARSALSAMVAAAVVLVVLAVVIALTAQRDPAARQPSPAAQTTPTPTAGPGPGSAVPAPSAPATSTATTAGALAFSSVPLTMDGVAASLTFGGVLLEQHAVGLTVTYPSLSLSTDGRQALAHVRLPTFNCLTSEPPADPLAAGCRRSLTEYADLSDPGLQVSRRGDRLDVAGLFPTYTRPKGSPPVYTGRAYQLTATVSSDGAGRGAQAAATGILRIGLDSAASTPVPGVNVLQFPG